jgi:hypothetical protein
VESTYSAIAHDGRQDNQRKVEGVTERTRAEEDRKKREAEERLAGIKVAVGEKPKRGRAEMTSKEKSDFIAVHGADNYFALPETTREPEPQEQQPV